MMTRLSLSFEVSTKERLFSLLSEAYIVQTSVDDINKEQGYIIKGGP